MKRYEIQNYLPFRRQQRSKQESSCPLFYGDFALVNSRFEVLASRGVHMPEGKRVSLSGVGHRFLSMHLTDRTRVATRDRSGIRIFSGELLPLGVTAVITPHGNLFRNATAMCYLSEHGEMLVSPQTRKVANAGSAPEPDCGAGEDADFDGSDLSCEAECMAAENELLQLDAVLRPGGETALADYCRCVADYAGSRIDLTCADDIPLSACGRRQGFLTVFLLCAFLTARKTVDSGAEVAVSTGQNRLCVSVRIRFPSPNPTPLRFLQSPIFESVSATPLPDGYLSLTVEV